MKNFRVKENGISLIALVITIIVLIILTNVLVYNSLDRIYIKKITNLITLVIKMNVTIKI